MTLNNIVSMDIIVIYTVTMIKGYNVNLTGFELVASFLLIAAPKCLLYNKRNDNNNISDVGSNM